jgi:RNA polymerase sigma-70 factor (ECF subfamily)
VRLGAAVVIAMADSQAGAALGATRESLPAMAHPDDRLRACVGQYLGAVWRLLRRSGVPAADADDAAQQVFLVLARRMDDVLPGRELAFLLRTAVRVASQARRTHRRRPEVSDPSPETHPSSRPSPEHELVEREELAQLDAILGTLDESLRVVFVLYEIEEMTMAAIADVLGLPPGTVASRLRRARERFEVLAGAVRADVGGPP